MDKTEKLLRMMEHPELYSDEQFQELLTDEECRELYEAMRLSADAFAMVDAQAKMANDVSDEEWQRFESKHRQKQRPLMRWAAVFIGIFMLSAVAWAVWHIAVEKGLQSSPSETQTVKSCQQKPAETSGDIVRFDNIQLDSVLTIIAQHYQKQIAFRNESVRSLHFHIEWNQAAPLSDFITLINNFDGINLREEQDTIIAE